jgi:hypothetical protein
MIADAALFLLALLVVGAVLMTWPGEDEDESA